jgi:hypothetical protein
MLVQCQATVFEPTVRRAACSPILGVLWLTKTILRIMGDACMIAAARHVC